MRKSIQGVVVAGAAVALLAACGGGGERADQAAPPVSATIEAAAPAAPAAPAAQPAPAEPTTKTPTKPRTKPPSTPPKPPKPPRPVIGTVSTTPQLSCDGGWCRLPATAGTVTFRVEATGARQVEVFLVPTGNETWNYRKSLGVDRDGSDGWSVSWAYGDESVSGSHLTVVAQGAGGKTWAQPFNLYRE